MKLIGRIVCMFKGHRRGVRVFTPDGGHRVFACPRCGNERRYKERTREPHPGNNGQPSDGSPHFQET